MVAAYIENTMGTSNRLNCWHHVDFHLYKSTTSYRPPCVQVNSERDVTYYSYMLICRVTYTGSNNNKNSMC